MNIYLIGYRCTGKTTIGNALAKRLNRGFLDTDEMIVAKNKMTIAQMVSENGWEFFREQEHQAVQKASELKNHVVATGGGAMLDPKNVAAIKKTGKVVWLKARPETIEKWMVKDKKTHDNRPGLTEKGVLEEIEEILESRTPLYEAASDYKIVTDAFDIDDICSQIIDKL